MNVAILGGCASISAGCRGGSCSCGRLRRARRGAYRVLISRAFRHLQHARDTRELLFQHLRTMTEGIKELKIHAGRRRAFMTERLEPTVETLRRDSVGGLWHHVVATSWNQFLFYALARRAALHRSRAARCHDRDAHRLPARHPLHDESGVGSHRLLADLRARPDRARQGARSRRVAARPMVGEETGRRRIAEPFARLELDGVVFAYGDDADGPGFVLGPIDLSLGRGELVFLVGGNGSGKSTFVKVLTGLYPPTVGPIAPQRPASSTTRTATGTASTSPAVFSDFYLFDSLLGLDGEDLDARAQRYLVRARARTQGPGGAAAGSPRRRSRRASASAWPCSRRSSRTGRSTCSMSGRPTRTSTTGRSSIARSFPS